MVVSNSFVQVYERVCLSRVWQYDSNPRRWNRTESVSEVQTIQIEKAALFGSKTRFGPEPLRKSTPMQDVSAAWTVQSLPFSETSWAVSLPVILMDFSFFGGNKVYWTQSSPRPLRIPDKFPMTCLQELHMPSLSLTISEDAMSGTYLWERYLPFGNLT